MPKDRSYNLRDREVSREPGQSRSLLAQEAVDDDEDGPTLPHQTDPPPQSSLSQTTSNSLARTPRTINRVRFEIGETDGGEHALNSHAPSPSQEGDDWREAEDYLSRDNSESRSNILGQRAPLLTNVEAPSVMVAEDLIFNAEEMLGNTRPKSGIM